MNNKQPRKKVLLSAYACSPTKGSEEGNGWSWATGLVKAGYEVWCFTNVAFEKEINRAMDEVDLPHLHFVFVRLQPVFDNHFLDPDSKKIYLHYTLWRRKAARIALKMHTELGFDIAHHVTYGSLQQGNFIWKIKGARKIFGPVGGGQKALPIFKKYFGRAWRTEQIRNIVSEIMTSLNFNFKRSLSEIDFLLVTNDDTLRMSKRTALLANESIHFIPDHAVPRQMENLSNMPRTASDVLRLLWVGRILPRKGLNLVLDALGKVDKSINYHLTIVGGGPNFKMVQRWIQEADLAPDRITITGRIPFDEVIQYYQRSDAFIFCSLRDSFPMQISEALAFGLPVITLNMHGSAIALPNNCGIKITPTTAAETLSGIAKAVERLERDIELRNELSRNALAYTKNNTWNYRIKTVTDRFYQ